MAKMSRSECKAISIGKGINKKRMDDMKMRSAEVNKKAMPKQKAVTKRYV